MECRRTFLPLGSFLMPLERLTYCDTPVPMACVNLQTWLLPRPRAAVWISHLEFYT